jgi:hypothetical protein
MSERSKALLVWPVAGFFVVIAFGVGLISEAAFGGSAGVVTASSTESTAGENAASIELGDPSSSPPR